MSDKITSPRVAFGEALAELGNEFPDLYVLDADVCTSTQTHFFREKYPDRFIQCGIAEANMIGLASGMSTVGITPFVSAFAVFLALRAADQIRVSVAYPNLNVKINGAYAGLPTGKAGATHSSVADLALMRAMPNMTVLVPGDPEETKAAVRLSLEIPGPVYLRTVRCPVPNVFPSDHKLELGKGAEIMDGTDVAIISTGMMTPKAFRAGELLRKKGIKARVVHIATVKPIDKDAVLKAGRECGHIITVENHSVVGGLGSAVSDCFVSGGYKSITRIGFPDIFLESGDNEVLFSQYKMNIDDIVQTVESVVRN